MANLTEAQIKVLKVLREDKEEMHNRVLGPGYIGSQIWGKPYRQPQAYARIAGKVLNALRKKDLVDWRSNSRETHGWIITFAGLRALKETE